MFIHEGPIDATRDLYEACLDEAWRLHPLADHPGPNFSWEVDADFTWAYLAC